MSQVPNICIDIFSHISDMMAQFQSVSTNPNSTFSHTQGFHTPEGPLAGIQNPISTPGNVAGDTSGLFTWFLFAALIFFLAFGRVQPPRHQDDMKAQMRRQGGHQNGNGGPGSGGIH